MEKYIEKVNFLQTQIKEAESVLLNLKNELNDMVLEISSDKLSQDDKYKLAKYLYWEIPEIKSKKIFRELFDLYPTSTFLQTSFPEFICHICNQQIIIKSRTDYLQIKSSKKRYKELTCDNCQNKKHEIYLQKREQNEQIYKEYIQNLKNIPYKEYLQTEHWQNLRTKFLKYSDYKCSLCNKKNIILNVHHRTYENRGCESYRDLICLCKDCHEKFHNIKDKHESI